MDTEFRKERSKSVNALLWGGAILACVFVYHLATAPRCTAESVPYTNTYTDDPNSPAGLVTTVTPGVSGSDRVCRDSGGAQVSRATITAPIAEIDSIGNNADLELPDNAVFYETVCLDGSFSSSSGRGTCSWHGGVGRTLFKLASQN